MSWKPEEKAWMAYFKFEERVKDFDKSREVMYRYLEGLINYI
jgi:crooked neck